VKIIGYILIFLISFTSCMDIRHDEKQDAQFVLKGTEWTSKFFKYRNNYNFITDSTGFSQHGEVSWHFPSKDSLDYEVDDSFRYFITTNRQKKIKELSFIDSSFFHILVYQDKKYEQ
jgi:hypothetical protein